MLSRLFIILLFVPFLLWIFLKGDILLLIFTMVIIGMSLYEFYKMLKDKGYEVASRIGMGLGLFPYSDWNFLNRLIMIWEDL